MKKVAFLCLTSLSFLGSAALFADSTEQEDLQKKKAITEVVEIDATDGQEETK